MFPRDFHQNIPRHLETALSMRGSRYLFLNQNLGEYTPYLHKVWSPGVLVKDKVVNATRVSHGPSTRIRVKTLVPTTWLIYASSDVFYQGLGQTLDVRSQVIFCSGLVRSFQKRGSCLSHMDKRQTPLVMTLGEFFKS